MVGLLDIAPVGEPVTIRGASYPVRGLSVGDIAVLLTRFPALKQLLGGQSIDFAAIAAMSGEAVTAIIAAGLGHSGEADYEAALANLTLDEQAEVFAVILRLTMPGGVVPFVGTLEKLMNAATPPSAPAQGGRVPSTKSRK